jgi:hypothetical protein
LIKLRLFKLFRFLKRLPFIVRLGMSNYSSERSKAILGVFPNKEAAVRQPELVSFSKGKRSYSAISMS